MLNKVILMGRLTKDPELKTTPTGTSVCSFSVAVDRRYTKQGEEKKTDFINCVSWRQQAEFVSKYFNKGSMINIVGNLQTRTYDDRDGKKVYVTEVVVDEVNFCGSKAESNTGGYGDVNDNQSSYGSSPAFDNTPTYGGSQIPPSDDGFSPAMEADDDLPF